MPKKSSNPLKEQVISTVYSMKRDFLYLKSMEHFATLLQISG